jgi:hypothetical protein
MPAIGRDLTRRALLAGVAALAHAAEPAVEAWEVIAEMASALGRAAPTEFLSRIDRAAPGFAALRANVAALVAAADVESSVDPVSNEGDAAARDLEVDWQLHLVDRTGLGRVTRRRQTVKCRIERRGRAWKVVALEPVSFFAVPSAGLDLAHEGRSCGRLG